MKRFGWGSHHNFTCDECGDMFPLDELECDDGDEQLCVTCDGAKSEEHEQARAEFLMEDYFNAAEEVGQIEDE